MQKNDSPPFSPVSFTRIKGKPYATKSREKSISQYYYCFRATRRHARLSTGRVKNRPRPVNGRAQNALRRRVSSINETFYDFCPVSRGRVRGTMDTAPVTVLLYPVGAVSSRETFRIFDNISRCVVATTPLTLTARYQSTRSDYRAAQKFYTDGRGFLMVEQYFRLVVRLTVVENACCLETVFEFRSR